jgi:hypothetical protein
MPPQKPPQKLSKTQVINEYCQGNKSEGRLAHPKIMQVFECDGHTDTSPKWGCKLIIDGVLRGHAVDYVNTQNAKEEACRQAAKALGLYVDEDD